jgi:hypothetical protein
VEALVLLVEVLLLLLLELFVVVVVVVVLLLLLLVVVVKAMRTSPAPAPSSVVVRGHVEAHVDARLVGVGLVAAPQAPDLRPEHAAEERVDERRRRERGRRRPEEARRRGEARGVGGGALPGEGAREAGLVHGVEEGDEVLVRVLLAAEAEAVFWVFWGFFFSVEER